VRRTTPERLDALQLADSFVSLPPNLTRMQLLDAIEIARRELDGLTDAEYAYLRLAFRCVPESDWHRGSTPVFTWARNEIAYALFRSEASITRLEQSLVRKGLIVHRDAPRHQRFRSKDNGISYGVSLAPVAARASEILQLKEKVLLEHRQWRTARRRLYELRNEALALLSSIETGRSYLEDIIASARNLPNRIPATMDLMDVEKLVEFAEQLVTKIKNVSFSSKTAHQCSKCETPNKQPESPYPDTCTTQKTVRSKPVPAIMNFHNIARDALMAGITEPTLVRLVRTHGAGEVSECLSHLMDALSVSRPIRSPAAYLTGILKKRSTDRQKYPVRC